MGVKQFSIPAIQRERAQYLEKKVPKIEKAIMKIYGLTQKKLTEVDPKKVDAILKMK